MGFRNPQASFEDAIFGPNGMHPTPKELPYPKRPLKTIYGETREYVIPPEEKAKVLRDLFPFGNPPSMRTVWRDIHSGREFAVGDYKVVEQNGYVLLVSPYFAEDGASVVDWEPISSESEEFFAAKVMDSDLAAAFSAGYADGFTGRAEGEKMPERTADESRRRYEELEDAYREGYGLGSHEHREQVMQTSSSIMPQDGRRSGRRPR